MPKPLLANSSNPEIVGGPCRTCCAKAKVSPRRTSTSSRTTARHWSRRRLTALMCSPRRPGVATTTSTPSSSASFCVRHLNPPAHRDDYINLCAVISAFQSGVRHLNPPAHRDDCIVFLLSIRHSRSLMASIKGVRHASITHLANPAGNASFIYAFIHSAFQSGQAL